MKTPATRAPAPRDRQAGVGLIEVMVAMAIGLVLMAGAMTLFMQSRNTSRTSDSVSRMQEAMNYALDTIEPDVRMANYWGMTNRPDLVDNTGTPGDPRTATDALVTGNCGVNWTADLERYVDGRNNGNYDLACAGVNPTAWSDVLIVRRTASTDSVPAANRIQLQTTRIAGTMFADGIRPAGYAAPPVSVTRDLVVNAYYVGEVLPSPNGVQTWALRRKQLAGGANPQVVDLEIVRGISDMQVQFGVDQDGDNNADAYVNPEAAELAAGRVVSVRLWLVAMADEREVGFVDGRDYTVGDQAYGVIGDDRRRLVVSKVIQLRNSTVP